MKNCDATIIYNTYKSTTVYYYMNIHLKSYNVTSHL